MMNSSRVPFAGAHEVKFAEDMPQAAVEGLTISVTGETKARKEDNGSICLSSILKKYKPLILKPET
jgi:hypothetical protein